jgi:hypothetical protein
MFRSSFFILLLEVRRELLVKHFDEQIASKGETAVLYDLLPGR